jgi:hypothetical protein
MLAVSLRDKKGAQNIMHLGGRIFCHGQGTITVSVLNPCSSLGVIQSPVSEVPIALMMVYHFA